MTAKSNHPADVWRLTNRERQVVELYITLGLGKLVACELGVNIQSVDRLLARARMKSGHRVTIPMLIEYDRASVFARAHLVGG